MTTQGRHYDVIVVGAGLIGLAFALRLAQSTDFKIALVERSKFSSSSNKSKSEPDKNQRVIALGSAAISLLKDIDVFPKLKSDVCHPYTDMHIWEQSSIGSLTFSAQDYQQSCLGYMVDAIALTSVLQESAHHHPNIELIDSFKVVDLQLHDEVATLESNTALQSNTTPQSGASLQPSTSKLSASLIVAADGAHSWVRRQAKIFAHQHPYQQRGIVAKIATSESHQDTAWQVFLKTGPLAILPLHNNQSSIVWSVDNDQVDALLDLSSDAFSKSLAHALGGRLGNVDLLNERQSFELMSVRSERYFKHRLALIGDAAHSIHPLAGQGANLGFKDAAALADILTGRKPEQLGELAVLQRYQQARKADNEQTDTMMSVLHKAYQEDASCWQTIRGLSMNMLSSSLTIKSLLVKQAMGL